MASHRTTRSLGPVDYILGSVLASVLLVTTACGAAPAPTDAPPSSVQGGNVAQAPLDDVSPMDGDVVPDAGGADLASNIQPPFAAKALDILATIPVKGRAPKTGYSRTEFGPAWADVDHNGCDTRNDILDRDLTAKTFKAGTHDCIVLTGKLADPYTGTTIPFERGVDTSSKVQIDHVVALSDAWQKGAQQLSVQQRTALANDPLNLLAADGPANQQKSDSDASSWLPANKSFRCDYVARQISVKATYKLWVTAAERDAMTKVLNGCTGTTVPTTQKPVAQDKVVVPPAAPIAPTPAPAPVKKPAPPVNVVPEAPAAVVYANCAAVRAAGAAPLLTGQPGYSTKLDRDKDGIACE